MQRHYCANSEDLDAKGLSQLAPNIAQKVKINDMDNEKKPLISGDVMVRRVLAIKRVLAWIMRGCIPEFRDMEIDYIAKHCIEGNPVLGVKQVHDEPVIKGNANESKSTSGGTVVYDIIFNAVVPGNSSTGDKCIEFIINVEAQNKFNPGYDLLKRAVYYCSRMISDQYGQVFTNSHYEKIQKVYSIWICVDPINMAKNTIMMYNIGEHRLVGNYQAEKAQYDLLTIVMIHLGNAAYSEAGSLLAMLDTLLQTDLKPEERLTQEKLIEVMNDEFGLFVDDEEKEVCVDMCNVMEYYNERSKAEGVVIGKAEGVVIGKAEGVAIGKAEGVAIGKAEGYTQKAREVVFNLRDKVGLTDVNQIAAGAGLTVEEVKEILKVS